MIEIDQTGWAEPAGFDADCRQQGAAWLAKHPKATRKTAGKRPKDFWSKHKPALADAFRNLCAYGAMYEPVGTVDHFLPVDVDESLGSVVTRHEPRWQYSESGPQPGTKRHSWHSGWQCRASA